MEAKLNNLTPFNRRSAEWQLLPSCLRVGHNHRDGVVCTAVVNSKTALLSLHLHRHQCFGA